MNKKYQGGLIVGIMVLIIGGLFASQPIVKISGRSMEPNYKNNSRRWVNKLAYLMKGPKRGEVVFYQQKENKLSQAAIGRIVGMPGEVVEFRNKSVWVDGKILPEDYLAKETETYPWENLAQIKLGQDEYVILGDNRSLSKDSRIWGTVNRREIWGKFW